MGGGLGARRIDPLWRVRLATAGLWLLIGLAAAGGLRALVSGPAGPPVPAPAASPAGAAGGFAEMFVAAYLEAGAGREQDLSPFYPGPVSLAGITPGGHYASRTATVAATRAAPGYWSITVGAEVLVSAQGGYVREGTHYYRMGILAGPEGMVATTLPAEVPPPTTATLPRLDLPSPGPPTDDAPTQVVGQFFAAYLAGQGAFSAFVAPRSDLRPLVPPPFAITELTGIAFGPAGHAGTRPVRARVTATGASGMREVLDYSLHMSERRGRWTVDEILPAAPLAAASRH